MFDLPTSVSKTFAQSLRARLVEKTTESWMFRYGLLEAFAKEYGHCRMTDAYKVQGGYDLGKWLQTQRSLKETMGPDRSQRLEALPGWIWDPFSEKWEKGFDYLKQFVEREGHCRVPQTYKTDDGYRLGVWISGQVASRNVTIRPDRRERLEAFPGWSWDPGSDRFNALFEEGFSMKALR